MFQKKKLSLLCASLLLMACTAQVGVTPIDPNDPEPTPTPTVAPTATPTPLPSASATPGWSQVVIQANVSNYTMFMTEVRRLQNNGQVTGVVELSNYTVRFNASAEVAAYLRTLAVTQIIGFSSLLQASLSVQSSFRRVINNGSDFVSFWRQYVSSLDSVPGVDFSTHSVIAIFPGPRPTTGYTTSVVDVMRTNKQLKIRYKVTAAATGTPSNFTPVHIVVIPLSQLRGDFDQVFFEEIN